jgi:hypothetical protein
MRDRFTTLLVVAVSIMVAAGCSPAAETPSTTATTQPPTTSTTEHPASTTSSAPVSTTTIPRIGPLTMTPGPEVSPGDYWEVCGTYWPGQAVVVNLSKPGTDLSWLPENGVFMVPTSPEGVWCWSGIFPSQMQDRITWEVSPIQPGRWVLIASEPVTGLEFARADVQIP